MVTLYRRDCARLAKCGNKTSIIKNKQSIHSTPRALTGKQLFQSSISYINTCLFQIVLHYVDLTSCIKW